MRVTYFGAYDFNADGVGVLETAAPRRFASSFIAIPGADGAFDPFGTGQSPKQPIQVTVRFQVRKTGSLNIDQQLNAFLQVATNGQQWLKFLLVDGTTTYHALAKCIDVQPNFSRRTLVALPLTATFELAEPFWYAASSTTLTFSVSALSTAVDLTNAGTAPLVKATLQFVGTCQHPKFLNNTNGYSFILNQDFATSKTLLIDLGAQTVTVDGVDAWADVAVPATQVGLFKWNVGVNSVSFSTDGGPVPPATPSGTVTIVYRTTYQ